MQTRHIYCGTSLASALEHFHTWCIGWSAASAVQLRFGNETALPAEVTETLPQALKHDPRTDGSYGRLKACSTHRLYARCETAIRKYAVTARSTTGHCLRTSAPPPDALAWAPRSRATSAETAAGAQCTESPHTESGSAGRRCN